MHCTCGIAAHEGFKLRDVSFHTESSSCASQWFLLKYWKYNFIYFFFNFYWECREFCLTFSKSHCGGYGEQSIFHHQDMYFLQFCWLLKYWNTFWSNCISKCLFWSPFLRLTMTRQLKSWLINVVNHISEPVNCFSAMLWCVLMFVCH